MSTQDATQSAALRALTYRLQASPPIHLPKVIPQIAAALWHCRQLLSAPSDAQQGSQAHSAVTRYKTQLATLLQDRTVEGRWSAVVLAKATVEAGGLEVLSKSKGYVLNLLAILKRPDPPTTRKLVVLTLTRIFMLTWDHQNLVREITTPHLTAFVQACLVNIDNKRCSAGELQYVLEAFATLLPKHPTIFRSNESKLRSLLAAIISSSSSDQHASLHYTEAHQSVAARLWVSLSRCAPKDGANAQWEEMLRNAVNAAHATCDRVFRAVREDWQSAAGVQPSVASHLVTAGELQTEDADAVGLQPWKGVYAGSDRLVSLVHLIQASIATESPGQGSVPVRIGFVTDLIVRLFGVTIPQPGKQDFIKFNNQISKDEREALFAVLPKIHVATASLCFSTLERFDQQAFTFVHTLKDQALWVFQSEASLADVREALYSLFTLILGLIGPTMSKSDIGEFSHVLRTCCQDVLSSEGDASRQPAQRVKQATSKFGLNAMQTCQADFSDLCDRAGKLLSTALNKLDSSNIPPKLRTQIDRSAVLRLEKDLLFASVLNPARKPNTSNAQPSLLPILAREFPSDLKVEALLRPRMPPIFVGRKTSAASDMDEIDEAMEDNEEEGDADDPTDYGEGAPFGLLDGLTHDFESESDAQTYSAEISDQASKRKSDGDDKSVSAKRVKASAVADSLMPEAAQNLPGPDPETVKASTPRTVVMECGEEAGPVTVVPPANTDTAAAVPVNQSARSAPAPHQPESSGDDSDFEMPPLTMEPDTDPEAEEEEEEEDDDGDDDDVE